MADPDADECGRYKGGEVTHMSVQEAKLSAHDLNYMCGEEGGDQLQMFA